MKRRLLGLILSVSVAGAAGAESLVIDDFEAGLKPGWRVKSFVGETRYQVVPDDGGQVLQAQSQASASGLIYDAEVDPRTLPILSWRWKVAGTVPGGDAHTKAGDDYAARLYVIFPRLVFWKTRTLNYIWANRLPQGESVPNPFTGNAMMIAVESGPEKAGQWRSERRNILEDYRRMFGEEPPQVGAVAIMTDTDNTGTSASAWYDDIRFSSE